MGQHPIPHNKLACTPSSYPSTPRQTKVSNKIPIQMAPAWPSGQLLWSLILHTMPIWQPPHRRQRTLPLMSHSKAMENPADHKSLPAFCKDQHLTDAWRLVTRMPPELARQSTHELPQLAPEISPNLSGASSHRLGPNVLWQIHHNIRQTTGRTPSSPCSILRTN